MYILICTLVVMGSSCSEENLNLLFDLLYHLVLIIQEIVFLINDVAAKLSDSFWEGGGGGVEVWWALNEKIHRCILYDAKGVVQTVCL